MKLDRKPKKGREDSRLSRGTAGHGLFVVAAIF